MLDCESGDIRLVSINNPLHGRVEVCFDGVWGTVCDRLWNNADAAVACRQLGYSSLGTLSIKPLISSLYGHNFLLPGASARTRARFGQGTGAIIMDNVRCRGTEQKLSRCPHDSIGIQCSHSQDAGVECIAGELSTSHYTLYCPSECEGLICLHEGCAEGEIRLADGMDEMEGRVEICIDNIWGTICSQMWNDIDAGVVCRQLQLNSAGRVCNYSHNVWHSILRGLAMHQCINLLYIGTGSIVNFGGGESTIWLSNVQCTGSEQKLIDCPASSDGIDSCIHVQDAGVRCLPGTYVYFLL